VPQVGRAIPVAVVKLVTLEDAGQRGQVCLRLGRAASVAFEVVTSKRGNDLVAGEDVAGGLGLGVGVFGVEVIAPVGYLARGCNRNALVPWGHSVEEMLDDSFHGDTNYVRVLIGRLVQNLSRVVNNLAALVVIDADGNEVASLAFDPWKSIILFEDFTWQSQSRDHPGWLEAASLFAFDLRDPSFREAVNAGGTVHVRWKAGDGWDNTWAWPAEFGDCTGDLLSTCRGVR
jgi:hypothetical protein